MIEKLQPGVDRPGLGIGSAINEALDPGMHERSGTHGAGFDGGEQLALKQPVVAENASGLAQSDDLRMRGGVGVGDVAVAATGHDLAFADHDGADWHFAHFERAARRAERFLHPKLIGGGDDRRVG